MLLLTIRRGGEDDRRAEPHHPIRLGRCNRQQDEITIRAVGVIHLCVLRASFVVNSVLLGSSPDRGALDGHANQTVLG